MDHEFEMTGSPRDPRSELDPVFRHARREAVVILIAWTVCLVWTVGYCWLYGYDLDPDFLQTTFGMPRWVVWGVLIPWLAATVFTTWFSLVYMANDDLGEHEIAEGEGPPNA